MGLETGSTISSLITSNPTSSDPVNQGDNHIRLIKAVLQEQFPGSGGLGFNTAITTTETELNSLHNSGIENLVASVHVDASGNVGIGTSSPGGDATNRSVTASGSGSASFNSICGTVVSIYAATSSNGLLGTSSNHPLVFNTNATERTRITESGNVGIGTANPAQRLHVVGNSYVSGTTLLADAGFMFNSDAAQDTGMSWASEGVMNVRCNGATVGQFNSAGFTGNSATASYAPLISGTAQNALTTEVLFSSIPSWAKRITVMFNEVSTSGTSAAQVRLGGSGGVENTGYKGQAGNLSAAPTVLSSGFTFIAPPVAVGLYSGSMTLTLLGSNIWAANSIIGRSDLSGTTSLQLCAGTKATSGVLDRVSITMANGTDTFDAGTINIMYE